MTVKEFAERAEISLTLAYDLIARGSVPHRRIGKPGKRGTIRITEEDFAAFMEGCKVAATPSRATPARPPAPVIYRHLPPR